MSVLRYANEEPILGVFRSRRVHEAVPQRVGGCSGPIGGTGFLEDVSNVGRHGLRADE